MRKLIIVSVLFVIATVAMAQGFGGGQRQRMDPTEMYSRMADRLVKQLKLDDEKAGVFKVLYLDYQMARHNAANPKGENAENERIDVKKLTDEQATELIEKQFKTQEAQLAVDKDYLSKFLEILTPTQAAQIFVQRLARQGMQGQGMGGNGRMGGGRMGGGGFGGGFGGGDF